MDFRRYSEKNMPSDSSERNLNIYDVLKAEATKPFQQVIDESIHKSEQDIDDEFVSTAKRTVDEISMTIHNPKTLNELKEKYDQEINTLSQKKIPQIKKELEEANENVAKCEGPQKESKIKKEDSHAEFAKYANSAFKCYETLFRQEKAIKECLLGIKATFVTERETKNPSQNKIVKKYFDIPKWNTVREMKILFVKLSKLRKLSRNLKKSIEKDEVSSQKFWSNPLVNQGQHHLGKNSSAASIDKMQDEHIKKLISKFSKKQKEFNNYCYTSIKKLSSLIDVEEDIKKCLEEELKVNLDPYTKKTEEYLDALKLAKKKQRGLKESLKYYQIETYELLRKLKNVEHLEAEIFTYLWKKQNLETKRDYVKLNHKLISPPSDRHSQRDTLPSQKESSPPTDISSPSEIHSQIPEPKKGIYDYHILAADKPLKQVIDESIHKSEKDIDDQFVSTAKRTVDEISMTNHTPETLNRLKEKYDQEINTLSQKKIPRVKEELKQARNNVAFWVKSQRLSEKTKEDLRSIFAKYTKEAFKCRKAFCQQEKDIISLLNKMMEINANSDTISKNRKDRISRNIDEMFKRFSRLCKLAQNLEDSIKKDEDFKTFYKKKDEYYKKKDEFRNYYVNNIATKLPIVFDDVNKEINKKINDYYQNATTGFIKALTLAKEYQIRLKQYSDSYQSATGILLRKVEEAGNLQSKIANLSQETQDFVVKKTHVELNHKLISSPSDIHSEPDTIYSQEDSSPPSGTSSPSDIHSEPDTIYSQEDSYPPSGASSPSNIHSQRDTLYLQEDSYPPSVASSPSDIHSEPDTIYSQKDSYPPSGTSSPSNTILHSEEQSSSESTSKADPMIIEAQITSWHKICSKRDILPSQKESSPPSDTILHSEEQSLSEPTSKVNPTIIEAQNASWHERLLAKLRAYIYTAPDIYSQRDILPSQKEISPPPYTSSSSDIQPQSYTLPSQKEISPLSKTHSRIDDPSYSSRKTYRTSPAQLEDSSPQKAASELPQRMMQDANKDGAQEIKPKDLNKKFQYKQNQDDKTRQANIDKSKSINITDISRFEHELEHKLKEYTEGIYIFNKGEDELIKIYNEIVELKKKINNPERAKQIEQKFDKQSSSEFGVRNQEMTIEELKKELQQYSRESAPSKGNNCSLYALMMAADYDLKDEKTRRLVEEIIAEVRDFLDTNDIAEKNTMLDLSTRSGHDAIKYLKEQNYLGDFTNIVVYAIYKGIPPYKWRMLPGEEGQKPLRIYFNSMESHYYALIPKNPAKTDTLPSQKETSLQPKTVSSHYFEELSPMSIRQGTPAPALSMEMMPYLFDVPSHKSDADPIGESRKEAP
jgi:hypothetical protein